MDSVVEALRIEVSEAHERLAQAAISGGPADYSQYMRLVGRAEAMQMVLGFLDEIEQRFTDE